MNAEDMINQCRVAVGARPRRVPLLRWLTYLRTRRPKWVKGDKLQTFFDRQRSLFQHGVCCWGHIIQANVLLFEPGRDNCPGELVFPAEYGPPCDVDLLAIIASRVAGLRGTKQDDNLSQGIGDYLADERQRVFGVPAPPHLTEGMACAISTTFFNREHLPGRMLTRGLLPVLVLPEAPVVAAPLPRIYWPPALVQWWHDGARR